MDIFRTPRLHHLKLIILLLLQQRTYSESTAGDDLDEELFDIIHHARNSSLWTMEARSSRTARSITTASNVTDPTLWGELLHQCSTKTSFSCVKTGMFRYLDRNLEIRGDVRVSEDVSFRKNNNKYYGVCENSDDEKERCSRYYMERLNLLEGKKNEVESEEKSGAKTSEATEDDDDVLEGESRDLHGLSDVTEILYDKGTQFLMTHDLEFVLPRLIFGGGAIKIEPKSFIEGSDKEEEGVMVKVVFKPPPSEPETATGRLFFEIKRLFKKKLMHSFMALVLIIKMIKVKLMFLLPMIVGQTTAKKLLLKALLFLIPGLAHLFKLCHYYHLEHAKYHHHHHKIKHHHHHIKVPVPVPVPVPVHHPHHHQESYPPYPASHHVTAPVHGHLAQSAEEYDYSPHVGGGGGPVDSYGYGDSSHSYSDSNQHRNEYQNMFSQFNDNDDAMTSWGLGADSNENNNNNPGVLDAKDQPVYPYNHKGVVKKSPTYSPYYPKFNNYNSQGKLLGTQLHPLTPSPPIGVGAIPVVYDPFYSPILQKIDNIFAQLGFNEEACRERLVCSMYKAPHRYSPHSNLLSAELSRDQHELQRPTINNSAVVRFYKYVQAARDGQEQKNCLHLYSACTVNTEK